jgi:hypothetical protein
MMADRKNRLNGNQRDVAGANVDSSNCCTGRFFEIHVRGQLDSRWSEWFEGMEVKLSEDGEMILYGPIMDQAALLGVINKLSRLNLTLLSLHEVKKKMNKETK